MKISASDLEEGARVVYSAMPPTPQYSWPQLSERAGCEIWVKHENHSPIGCFKLRGGLAYVEHLKRSSGGAVRIIAPTSGNHGQSIALAADRFGLEALIIVPENNSPEKNAAIKTFGAKIIRHGTDYQQAREYAEKLVANDGYHMVRSFTPQLLRGVATYPAELFRAVHDIDVVYVPVGMGSGLCATLLVRDLFDLRTKVVGVVADGAPTYALSFERGSPVPTPEVTTMLEGLACRTPDPGVVDLIAKRAERFVRVTDDEAIDAAALFLTATHNLAELAGAASLAAVLKDRDLLRGKKVAIVLSGGNLDSSMLPLVLERINQHKRKATT